MNQENPAEREAGGGACPTPEQVRARCRSVLDTAVRLALELDPRQLEGQSPSEAGRLLEQADAAVACAREALGCILGEVEGWEAPFAQRVEDAAFMGRFALGHLQRELARTSLDDRWQVARLVDKTRRELLRSMHNAEVLFCHLLGVAPSSTYHCREVAIALETRRAYYSLLRGAERSHGPELWENLRCAANSLAKLCGREAFEHFRIYDRCALFKLRRRFRELFLHRSRGEADLKEGARVLAEYHNFVELAQEVNKRPELIEHDRVVLTQVQRDWHDLGYEAMSRDLRRVSGRDPRLDQAVECGVSADALAGIVDDVLRALGGKASDHWLVAADMRSA